MPMDVMIRGKKRNTHYFPKEIAEKIIEEEIYLNRKMAFQLGYDTGARAGEIIMVSAEHFKDDGMMVLWDSKKKAWKSVPLSEKTIRMVQTFILATKTKGKFFDVTTKTLNNWLDEAVKKHGLKPDLGTRIRWHSWRGTFIRTHRNLGDKWLMQVTGDTYQTLLGYYEELTEEDLMRAKKEA